MGVRQERPRWGAAYVGGVVGGAEHAPFGWCVHRVQCTPRLLAAVDSSIVSSVVQVGSPCLRDPAISKNGV